MFKVSRRQRRDEMTSSSETPCCQRRDEMTPFEDVVAKMSCRQRRDEKTSCRVVASTSPRQDDVTSNCLVEDGLPTNAVTSGRRARDVSRRTSRRHRHQEDVAWKRSRRHYCDIQNVVCTPFRCSMEHSTIAAHAHPKCSHPSQQLRTSSQRRRAFSLRCF